MKYILLILFFLSQVATAFSQVVIESQVVNEITVCQEQEEFSVLVRNDGPTTISNVEIIVALPEGISYSDGSFSNVSGQSVSIVDISDDTNLQFSTSNLSNGDSLEFKIDISAAMEAITFQNGGGTFRNNVEVNYTGGSESLNSSAYNILYPAFTITDISPTSVTVVSGETTTRTITIVNAGFGKTDLFKINRSENIPGISFISSNAGSTSNAGASIEFTGTDFQSIGNNDGYFDFGETLVYQETIQASGCNEETVTTTYVGSWGCGGDSIITENSYGHVTIDLRTPNLQVSSTNQESTCFGEEDSQQTLTIENTGNGLAKNVIVDIFKSSGNYTYDQAIFSALNQSSFTYQLNSGSQVNFTPSFTNTNSSNEYSCLGLNAAGQAIYTLPFEMQSNDVVIIRWSTTHCCINECLDQGNMGWQYTVDYVDFCENNTYEERGTGEDPTELNMTVFTESPSDIRDGEKLPFGYTISSHDNNLPEGEGAHYLLTFTLTEGLEWSEDNSDLTFYKNSTTWAPNSVVFDSQTRVINAKYPLPNPFSFEKSEIQIMLTGTCATVSSGTQTLDLDIAYVPDTTCISACNVKMICNTSVTTDLHCPLNSCDGIHFNGFSIERTSFGLPDNNLDGLPDGSGSLNENEIKTRRVMVGDTFKTVHKGLVHMDGSASSYPNLYASSTIQQGVHIVPVLSQVLVYDLSEDTNLVFDVSNTSYFDNSDDRTFRYALIPNELTPSSSYVFEDGDSVLFECTYKVTGNIGGQVLEVQSTNELFLSDVNDAWSNGSAIRKGCDQYDGRFTLIGYFFSNSTSENYTVRQCTRVIRQDFAMSIGDCCDNYDGGNLFPYEYRNWGHMEKVRVSIPVEYEVIDQYVTYRHTEATNSTNSHTIQNITPYFNSGGTRAYDLSAHYIENGGTVPFSDDGYSGTVYIEIAPTCDVVVNTFEDVDWEFQFNESTFLGGATTDWITGTADRLRFNPTSLQLNSTNPIVDGLGRSVTWNLQVINTTNNTDAANSWIHFKNPSGDMTIVSVVDEDDNEITIQGDIYQINTVNRGSTKNFTITATYSGCSPDYVVAYSGYECAGYPALFQDFRCSYTTYALQVEPKEAGMQTRISGRTVGDACSREVEVTLEIASVKSGHLDSIFVNVGSNTNSASLIQGESQIKYPIDGSFTSFADPTVSGDGYEYDIFSNYSAIAENGLPGVFDIDNSRFQLRFNMNLDNDFNAGDFITVQMSSEEICGQDIPQINLAYDPSIALSQNTVSGLTDLNGNTWGLAWVDYDNDGYDDVFVSEYDENEPNKLYRNNRDGSFTRITSGTLVTSNMSTVSSTWADYDNDGDMDVFLANNVGSENKLMTNTGGSFSASVSGDINTYGGYCHNASWVDYDNDGYLDLFVTDFFETKYNLLYHNNGAGGFDKVLDQSIAKVASNSIGATWADYDNDGDLDVFIPNARGNNNHLFENLGSGNFIEITSGDIVSDGGNSVGCSWGDYDNDGDMDLFVANTSAEPNFLYRNDGSGSFTKITTGEVVTDQQNSSGSSWVDINNDGDLDLFVTNDLGHESALYTNNGDGTFSKNGNPLNAVLGNSYPNAWSDFDNDGDMDVLIGNRGDEANVFFTNDKANCNAYLCVNLTGVQSNRNGIGAKIRVKSNIYGQDIWQMREISAQSGGGAGSQNSLKALFGLGDATIVDSLVIEWPSGFIQTLTNRSVNDCMDITEEEGNLVCGKIYSDNNGNCTYEVGEDLLANKMIEVSPLGKFYSTDENGEYALYLPNGSYDILLVPTDNWTTSCGNNIPITLSDQDICDNNFGLTSVCMEADLSVHSGMTALRRGFRNQISVTVDNESIYDANAVQLSLEVNNELVLLESNIAWTSTSSTATTNIYQWDIASIGAQSSVNLLITDSVSRLADLDKEITLTTSIGNIQDCDSTNNTFTELNSIVGSVDPNDILVFPSEGSVFVDEQLHYTIRFQNVGNYYASRVEVIDTIPEYLDMSSFRMEGQSHPFNYTINGNTVIWEVNDIYLIDSTTNEPESHGFIKFQITPREETPHKSDLRNRAAIQFDYNDFIITNTVSTIVVQDASLLKEKIRAFINPNPVTDFASIRIFSEDGVSSLYITQLTLRTVSGKILQNISIDSKKHYSLNMTAYETGIYTITVKDHLGRETSARILKQ